MPAPISTDLRIRIVESRAQEGLTYEELAERYQVGRATVDRVLRLARETGSVEPAAHAGGPARQIKEAEQKMLCELLLARPDATLEELCEALAVRTGVRVSAPTMCRELKRLGWSRKKNRWLPGSGSPRRSWPDVRHSSGGSNLVTLSA